jgi:hypothetical protein
MKELGIITLLLLMTATNFGVVQAQLSEQTREPQARKFDELTMGIGSPRSWWVSNIQEQEKEMKTRLLRYARQLGIDEARAYIIGYSPRIVEWEIYNRSYGEMRAGQVRARLSEFFDYRRITSIDGGFREIATSELWIVPPGAQPPKPTPTVKPEEVSHCPFLRITGLPYVPKPDRPLEFKAIAEANDKKIQPTFAWRVSQGQIISGQGTDTIKVELPNGASGGVIAMVNVVGYSLECPVETTTTTAKTTIGVNHFPFDEFGNISCEDELARLDNLAITLQNDPTLQVHIIIYGGRVGFRNEALARAARMKSYLVQSRGLEADRVMTVDGGYRNELSGELWLSSRGVVAPVAKPTVDKKYVRLRGTVKVINSPCSYG